MSIYVEIRVRAPLEELWRLTQTPALHERWDLRFTRIEYLPRTDESAPQRFLYATRIGFGLGVRGEGESVGTRDASDGSRTSALRFWSDDRKSLIREGSGYWRYIPTDDGLRFLTWYDYRTRFGAPGRALDRAIFRPLMGWATAWSFDRLRLWLERGVDPTFSMQRSLIHAVARCAIAFIFLYHGLVPKLLAQHADELAMLADAGLPPRPAGVALALLGAGEIAFAVALVVAWRARWLFGVTIALMVAATLGVAITSTRFLVAAF